jgi:hypothetical protein
MKSFYLIVILICSISIGFIALDEVAENLRLKREINDLHELLRKQTYLIDKCVEQL